MEPGSPNTSVRSENKSLFFFLRENGKLLNSYSSARASNWEAKKHAVGYQVSNVPLGTFALSINRKPHA